jgi:hypothetical protein
VGSYLLLDYEWETSKVLFRAGKLDGGEGESEIGSGIGLEID